MSDAARVFVVDDDQSMRESLRFLLEAAGFAVETFASARAFLDAGGAAKSGCLVADVRMPEMNGLALQEKLAADGSRLPVILMTGHADVPMAVSAMRAGAADFIEKPFADEALIASIRRALARAPERERPAAPAAVPAEVAERMARLTPREREVLDHLVRGSQHKVIAHELGISPRTIEVHRAHIMQKMEARNLAHLVRLVLSGDDEAGKG
ncbi:MAG: response regulator [Candidatus Odyssella sp.]|nr:response regulator [Candidatus Odyssella sp.]